MRVLRRFLALCGLLFWQGGFLFYSAVVIPIGLDVLQDRKSLQTWITDRATFAAQLTGAVAMALLLWEWTSGADPSRPRRRLRGGAWGLLALTLAGLFALHAWMHQQHPPGAAGVGDRQSFGLAHGLYIGVGLAQVVFALCYLALSLTTWRAEDFTAGRRELRPGPDGGDATEVMKRGEVQMSRAGG
jgi:hypothetical protein